MNIINILHTFANVTCIHEKEVQFYNRSCIHITAIQPYRSPHRNMPLDISQHGKTCSGKYVLPLEEMASD